MRHQIAPTTAETPQADHAATQAMPVSTRSGPLSLLAAQSDQVARLSTLQHKADTSPRTTHLTQLRARLPRADATGMPPLLRQGVEAQSGLDLSDVRVHRNSDEPARVGALAFAQGSNIHLAPGQERHLPHEAWHVVQQKQGRVRPTLHLGAIPVNDDPSLEAEADRMGAIALQRVARTPRADHNSTILQRRPAPTGRVHYPAIVGASNTPVHSAQLDQAGIAATSMSSADYDTWKNTLQGKFTHHGTCVSGDRTFVTQFKPGPGTMQLWGWPEWAKPSEDSAARLTGGLIMAEAVLTLAAAIAAGAVLNLLGTIPAVVGIVVGSLKFLRGALVYSNAPPATKKRLGDTGRLIEGSLAILGAANLTDFRKWPLIIFGIAKTLRSIVQFIADELELHDSSPGLQKGLNLIASGLHGIEAIAIFISGLEPTSLPGALYTASAMTVAGMKSYRAGKQADKALQPPGVDQAGYEADADVEEQDPNDPLPGHRRGDIEMQEVVEDDFRSADTELSELDATE